MRDSKRELLRRQRTCRGQRLRPLNQLPNLYVREPASGSRAKRHLNRFSQFCTTVTGLTDRQKDRQTTLLGSNNRLHRLKHCTMHSRYWFVQVQVQVQVLVFYAFYF